jgi:hypothetical protein
VIQVEVRTPRTQAPELRRAFENAIQQAALRATDRAAASAKTRTRAEMAAAGLGRLGNALGSGSDLKQSGQVHRRGDSWSASGWVFVRSQSKRTRGAIEAYTEGANIRPKKGPFLWFPSEQIQRVAGSAKQRERLTPGNWSKLGMDSKIGELVRIKSVNGYPLLVVKTASVALSGRKRSARALTKRGFARKGQIAKEFIVAFIGIPFTSRSARVDPKQITAAVASQTMRREFALTTSSGKAQA